MAYQTKNNICFKLHEVKIYPEYFFDVAEGRKGFELRKNDRNYEAGDFLLLRSYDKDRDIVSGEWVLTKITGVLSDVPGLDPEYAILNIKLIDKDVIPF